MKRSLLAIIIICVFIGVVMLTSITTESQTNGVQQQENEDIFNAAESGNIDKIRAFLAQGVDINSQSDNGTLLHIAAMKDSIETAKYLIKNGVNVDQKRYWNVAYSDRDYSKFKKII
ncbi:hypothetical protein C1M56_01875 [Vibrio diazotrophicus]|nr:hypothetical protein C1M56_01875 [Vibrio diazotrophicus]